MAEVEVTTHSETNFDPEKYIETFYTNFTGDKPEDKVVKFILDSLHYVFKDGQISGERLLDIGTGPVFHGIYSASKWFKEITLSDLSEPNLKVLRDWKAGNVMHQEAVFKYMTGLEGNHNLLKPGGHIIVVDVLGQDHYTIGKHRFRVLNATGDMIKDIYRESGFKIIKWKQAKSEQFMEYPPFLMVASKE